MPFMKKEKANPEKYNKFSILSIIFGFLLYPLGLAFAITALIQIKKTKEKGKGLAILAIVLPLGIALIIAFTVLIIWLSIKPYINIAGCSQVVLSLLTG